MKNTCINDCLSTVTKLFLVFILVTITACKTSTRNPSDAGIDPSLKAIPGNVFGEVLMEYYSAESETDAISIYKTREKVLFTFGSDGSLSATDQSIVIDDEYDIRDREFVWVDEENEFEYALSLSHGEISRLKVLSIGGGLFYGVFNLLPSESEANGNSNTVNDERNNTGNTLPENATGRHLLKFSSSEDELLLDPGGQELFVNEQEISFTFFSYGVMVLLGREFENMIVRGSEYMWVDTLNEVQYSLQLNEDDQIESINVYDLSGEVLYGWFSWLSREYDPIPGE